MATIPAKNSVKWRPERKRYGRSPNEKFYQSQFWKYGPPRAFLKENPVCAWHGKRSKCTKIAKIVDHIKAISDGGSRTDPKNWQALCKSCSSAKTNREIAKRRRKG